MKNTKKELEKNIWKIYLYQFLSGTMLFAPIIILFWQENGLSLTQIMILQSLFSIAVVLLEVPSGYFADIYGRKESLLLAGIFISLGLLAYGIGHTFFHFLVAEVIWAAGRSLLSGADSALVYDTLKDLKQTKRYKKIWGNTFFYNMVGIAFGSILGGFIAEISFRFTFFAGIPIFLTLIPLAYSLKEPKRHKFAVEKGYLKELIGIVRSCFVKKNLKWLIIYAGVIGGINNAAWLLYQPYFNKSGLPILYFGIVWASFQLIAALSSKYAHTIERKIGMRYSLILPALSTSLSYLLMGNFSVVWGFAFAYLQQFNRGFRSVVVNDYVNKLTKSEIRATVISVLNLSERLFYAAIIPFIGVIADVYSLSQAFIVSGITTFVVGLVLIAILFKQKIM